MEKLGKIRALHTTYREREREKEIQGICCWEKKRERKHVRCTLYEYTYVSIQVGWTVIWYHDMALLDVMLVFYWKTKHIWMLLEKLWKMYSIILNARSQ